MLPVEHRLDKARDVVAQGGHVGPPLREHVAKKGCLASVILYNNIGQAFQVIHYGSAGNSTLPCEVLMQPGARRVYHPIRWVEQSASDGAIRTCRDHFFVGLGLFSAVRGLPPL